MKSMVTNVPPPRRAVVKRMEGISDLDIPPHATAQMARTSEGKTIARRDDGMQKVFATQAEAEAWLRAGGKRRQPKKPPGEASNEEEVIQVGGKIRSVNVDDALRPRERPAAPGTALEKEIAVELSRPGNERVLAKVSEGGEVASFMAPVPHFSEQWYEKERTRKWWR